MSGQNAPRSHGDHRGISGDELAVHLHASYPGRCRADCGLGIAADVYHVWWDPELETEIKKAGARGRLLAFHVCEWLVPTRDMLCDRGMMGDGVIAIPRIREHIENAGYDGFYEVEIFSELDWWQRDPDEVMRVMVDRVGTCV